MLTELPVGAYELTASLVGFKRYLQTDIRLQVDENHQINVTLQVGEIAESVTVESEIIQVDTRSGAIKEVVDSERIGDLPLRNLDDEDEKTLEMYGIGCEETGCLRSALLAGAQASRKGCTVCTGLGHRMGFTRLSRQIPYGPHPSGGPSHCGAHHRPQAAWAARRNSDHLVRGVRPLSGQRLAGWCHSWGAATTTPKPCPS